MQVIINGSPVEVAALVAAMQERGDPSSAGYDFWTNGPQSSLNQQFNDK